MNEFLESSEYIDGKHPAVSALAEKLSEGQSDTSETIRRCFHFVRDEIHHSVDWQDNVLTARASEVLEARTGFCFAKSHLLAALLRVNNIPAALCYQRLRNNDGFCLHGLNAVYLEDIGWYRIDPRGNKPNVDAEFSPPVEQLAFTLGEGEENVPGFWSRPADSVIRVLTGYESVSAANGKLPDRI